MENVKVLSRSKLRDWTLDETLIVKEFAPFTNISKLAQVLHRHECDVYIEAARLMLMRPRPKRRLYWCNTCCNWRTKLNRDGDCDVCKKRKLVQNNEARIAELLTKLPPNEVETYSRFDTVRGSRVFDPKPKAPDTRKMSKLEAANARIDHAVAMEEWERKRLYRQHKANQKRIERIRRKVEEREANKEVLGRSSPELGRPETPALLISRKPGKGKPRYILKKR